jgi:hypothetical protein
VRVEDYDVDLRQAVECLDGGAAGVAGGGAHNGGAPAAGLQHMVHQAREELHRHVLEGERRAVEQLLKEEVRIELDEGRHGRMPEAAIGVAQHRPQHVPIDLAS